MGAAGESTKSAALQPSSPFRYDCLSGKIAVITGGGSGICFGITRELLRHGVAGVVICGRRRNVLERSAKILNDEFGSHRCRWAVCDVRDPKMCKDAIDFAMKEFGRLDILVNGAAGNFLAEARSLTPKGFATVMSIDALGTYNMSHCAYPALSSSTMNADGSSSSSSVIINISATLQYGATWWQSHASAAKSAVDSLTRSLALEWGSDKIRVVGIAPGPIADTPGTTKLAPGVDGKDVEEMVSEGIPLGRMGQANEIGFAAVFLCTAEYVTGDTLVVDGGEYLYRPTLVPKEIVGELSRKVEPMSRAQLPPSKL